MLSSKQRLHKSSVTITLIRHFLFAGHFSSLLELISKAGLTDTLSRNSQDIQSIHAADSPPLFSSTRLFLMLFVNDYTFLGTEAFQSTYKFIFSFSSIVFFYLLQNILIRKSLCIELTFINILHRLSLLIDWNLSISRPSICFIEYNRPNPQSANTDFESIINFN